MSCSRAQGGGWLMARARVVDSAVVHEQGEALKARLDNACCRAVRNRNGAPAMPGEEGLRADSADFVEIHAKSIIGASRAGLTGAETDRVLDALSRMDPIVAAEYLMALGEVSNARALTDAGFLNSIANASMYTAASLLFEIRITGETAALTDSRLFTKEALGFLDRIGHEAASEWFGSIARTGAVDALTSAQAMSGEMADAINGDGKIAGELSFAIGGTGRLDALSNRSFLRSLKRMHPGIAKEYLSAIWCTRRVDKLTSPDVMKRIAEGSDVWINEARLAGAPSVLIANVGGDDHDRGAKLNVRSWYDRGYDVIYLSGSINADKIVSSAISNGVSAIGIGIPGDSYSRIVIEASRRMGIRGFDGVAVFAGGAITQTAARQFQQAGIKVFGHGTDMMGLINALGLAGSVSKAGAVAHNNKGACTVPGWSLGIYGISSVTGTGLESAVTAATSSGIGDMDVYIKQQAFSFVGSVSPYAFSLVCDGAVGAYGSMLFWEQGTAPWRVGTRGAALLASAPDRYARHIPMPNGRTSAVQLAALQYAPQAAVDQFNQYAAGMGLTPAALTSILQLQQQSTAPSLSQQLAKVYGYGIQAPLSNFTSSQHLQAGVHGGAGLLYAASPFSAQAIAPGNMPLALSLPGTAGHNTLSFGEQSFSQSARAPIVPIANRELAQNTNASPKPPSEITPFNPLSLAFWETYGSEVPGYLASAAGGLVNWLITPPGFTQGGAPLAGGQFPYNYPYNQTYINELHKAETAAVNHTSKYLLQLQMQRAHAGLWAMAGARYEYLSPAFAGPYSVLTDPRISGADAAAVLSCGAGPDKILKGAMRGRNAPARSPILEAARERTTGGTADRKLVLNLLNGGAALLSAMPGYGSSSTAEREGIASTPACSDVSGRSRGRRGAAGLTGGGDAYFRSKALLDADATGLVHGLALNKSAETPSKAKRSGRLRSLAIMAGGAAAGFAAGIALFPAIANALSCL